MNKDELIDRVFAIISLNFTTTHDKGLKGATAIVECVLAQLESDLTDAKKWRSLIAKSRDDRSAESLRSKALWDFIGEARNG